MKGFRPFNFFILFGILFPTFLFSNSSLNYLDNNYNNKVSTSLMATSEVIVTVNWPDYAGENKVDVFNSSNVLIQSICYPSACYNGSAGVYSATINLGCVDDGSGYYLNLYDSYGDGWTTAGYVSVTSGGTTVINGVGVTGSSSGPHTFSVSGGGAACAPPEGPGHPDCVNNTELGGVAFQDYNSNGAIDGQEASVENIAVMLFDEVGQVGNTKMTNADGEYLFTGLTNGTTYRIEFGIPDYFEESYGADAKSSVQFAQPGTCDNNVGLFQPNDYCDTSNPGVVISCYEDGNAVYGGTGNIGKSMVTMPYNSSGGAPTGISEVALIHETGTTWGIAFQRMTQRMFSTSLLKRHSGLGSQGLGGVYVSDFSSGTGDHLTSFNLDGVIPANGGGVLDFGSITRSGSTDYTLPNNNTTNSIDLDAFDKVGKVGIGDADMNGDNMLWLVNLNQRALVKVDVSNTSSYPGAVDQYLLSSFSGLPSCNNGVLRPWGLSFNEGKGYLGCVCSAENGGTTADLNAYVLSFDPESPTAFTTELSFPLNYIREKAVDFPSFGLSADGTWRTWASDWSDVVVPNPTPAEIAWAQPILCDIDFADDGSMVLGFADRFGFQMGYQNYIPLSGTAQETSVDAAGDLLKVCNVNGAWILEGGDSCSENDAGSASSLTNDGPSGTGEFFYSDAFDDTSRAPTYNHNETFIGGLNVLAGTNEVAAGHYDPYDGAGFSFDLGLVWHNATTGARNDDFIIVLSGATASKGNNLGSFEYVCSPAPLSIGNYVWVDTDQDGIQDPDENGIAGVNVSLTDNNNTVIATTTTNGDGLYLFSDANVSGGINYNTNYKVKILLSDVQVVDPTILNTTSVNTGNGFNDNDAMIIGMNAEVAITTAGSGSSTYAIDFGFSAALPASKGIIGNYVWIDENADGFQDVGEPGIANVMVQLSDNIGTPIDTVITDAHGGYLFMGLSADDYSVQVLASTLPNGLSQTTNPINASADLGNQSQSYNITLGTDEENLTADFGFNWGDAYGNTGMGAIGDYVWIDSNGDGIQDGSEVGISNVTVSIYSDSNGDGLLDPAIDALVTGATDQNGSTGGTTTTEANGFYIFHNLMPGAYIVLVDDATLPSAGSAWTQTGDPDERDETATSPDHKSNPIVIAPGDTWLNADFGYMPSTPLNTVGDKVYLDTDADGSFSGSDTGISNVTVTLLDIAGNSVATTSTDSSGDYLFEGLVDGNYVVLVNDTDDVLNELNQSGDPDASLDNQSTVILSGGMTDLAQDFGYLPNGHNVNDGAIGDLVYIDFDNDGASSTGEGVANVTVDLYDAAGTNLIATVVTNENGNYLFGGLDPNMSYSVKVDEATLPGSVTNFDDPNGGNDSESISNLSTAGPIDLTQDFGYKAAGTLGSLGNLIWEDRNANGVVDASENGIEGITLDLYLDSNNDGLLNPGEAKLGSTTTDASGNYTFENLSVDGGVSYIVDVTDNGNNLTGYWHSTGVADTDDNSQADPYAVSLSTAIPTVNHADFGYYIDPAALGNYTWEDANGNGIQNGGESAVAGVDVILEIDFGGDNTVEVMLTSTSDANGFYSFGNLLLDEDLNDASSSTTYTISATSPNGFSATTTDVSSNGNDLLDSDDIAGVTAAPIQGMVDVALSNTSGVEASYDFGFVQAVNVGNYVWVDEDGDGDQDAGESGIPGVVLLLKDNNGATLQTEVTDFNGGYLFENVTPGIYTIEVDNTSLRPELNNQTYDAEGALDNSSMVTIATEDDLAQDFGYNYAPATDTNNPGNVNGAIGDRIWNDADSDGKLDEGEAGIGNVTVSLLDENGVLMTTVTDVAGNYIFDNLPAGMYSVVVDETTLPSGFLTVPTGDPDDDMTNESERMLLAPGDVYLDMDFGYTHPSASDIGSLIFIDENANGSFDNGESPMPGVSVALIDDSNANGMWDSGEMPIATTKTDMNGNYLFPGLADDNYVVVVTDTDNLIGKMTNTADPDGGVDEYSSVMLSGADDLIQNFGFTPNGHTTTDGIIGDFVFLDADGNNAFSVGESGLEDVKVELYDGMNNIVATTKTDANGKYLFGGLQPDTYKVKVDVNTLPGAASIPAGLAQSVDPDGGNDNESTTTITMGGQDLDQDFGYKASIPNTISGTIWEDTDANGTLDENALTLFEDVTVILLDNQSNIVGMTTTNAMGNFEFAGLPDGMYTVDVTDDAQVLADFWKSNGTNVGNDNNSQLDTYTVFVAGGSVDATSDFGYFKEGAALGNTIWIDRNNDGIQDSDEIAMPLVPVTLTVTFPNGTIVTATETTDAQGHYGFNNLLLDEDYNTGGGGMMPEFVLSVGTPANFVTTTVDANSNANDKEDSEDHAGVMAMPMQGQQNIVKFSDPMMESDVASYDFGFTLDCSSPVVHYAITNGAISNPGQTTDHFYQDTTQNLSTLTTHVQLAAQDGVIRSIDYCDFGNWSYYFNSSDPDEYLFAIEQGDNVTPIEYIELCVDDNPADRYAVGPEDATYVMARDWFVRTKNDAPLLDASGNPTTVNIRFYFPEEEFKEILDEAKAQAAIWGSTMPTVADVYWFKRESFDADTDIDDKGSSLKSFDINMLRNATTSELGVNTDDGTAGTTGNGKNHIQFNGITGFSGGTAAITIFNSPLPVALSNFEATAENCEVELKWQSESETNFSHYILESSEDGVNYEFVHEVPTLVSTSTEKKYSYTDSNITTDKFYRLKMLNLDGSYDYSKVVIAKSVCADISGLELYPNPVGFDLTSLNVKFRSKKEMDAQVVITNTLGNQQLVIPMQTTKGLNHLGIDVSNLADGVYIVTIRNVNAKISSQQFVKISQ